MRDFLAVAGDVQQGLEPAEGRKSRSAVLDDRDRARRVDGHDCEWRVPMVVAVAGDERRRTAATRPLHVTDQGPGRDRPVIAAAVCARSELDVDPILGDRGVRCRERSPAAGDDVARSIPAPHEGTGAEGRHGRWSRLYSDDRPGDAEHGEQDAGLAREDPAVVGDLDERRSREVAVRCPAGIGDRHRLRRCRWVSRGQPRGD